VPTAIRTAFVAPHDADRTEADLAVTPNRGGVVGCRIDHQSVVAVVVDQVPAQRAYGIGAQSVAVHVWI
jgi:hypothetical protein